MIALASLALSSVSFRDGFGQVGFRNVGHANLLLGSRESNRRREVTPKRFSCAADMGLAVEVADKLGKWDGFC